MRKSTILFALIFLVILGCGLIITALVFIFPHPLPVSRPESFSYDPHGFLFWTSEKLASEESSLFVRFENLTCDKGEVDVNVHVHYYLTKEENDGIAYFILQIPYTPDNVSVNAPVLHPSFVGGDFNVTRFEETAFLLVWIPRENVKSGLNYMNVKCTLKNSTYKLNYFTYEMDITFSTGFHDSVKNLSYFEIIRSKGDRLYLFAAKEMTLDVERPQFYMISQTTPIPDHIAAFAGKTWFRWDIKKMGSPRFRSNLVIIEFEHPREKHKYEVRYSATWLMLGVGIPLTLSSILELIKNINKTSLWKLIKTSKTLWLSVLILIIIFYFIYSYLVGYTVINLTYSFTDWLMAIGPLVAAVVALFVAFLPVLIRWWNKPKFKIEFKNEEPFCRRTVLVSGRKAYWIRLRVRNVGRSVARGCEGKLVRITDAKTKEDRKDFDPVVLRWVSTQAFEPIDINKLEYEYLDLVFRKSDDERKVFIVADESLRLGFSLRPPLKDYIFHVIIYGKNVEPLEKSYYYKSHFLYDKDELSEHKA